VGTVNTEDYENAVDAQLASSAADLDAFERGIPLADLVEETPADFLSDLLERSGL
jgi:hypothetical protein